MAGGLMQLVAYGKQNTSINSDDGIRLFRTVNRKITNFSIECINTDLDLDKVKIQKKEKSQCSVTILRNGDLVGAMFLQLKVSTEFPPGLDFGYSLIDNIEFWIGDTLVDRHTGNWLSIWAQLTTKMDNIYAYNNIIGNSRNSSHEIKKNDYPLNNENLYIPLQFFFNKSYNAALPLIKECFANMEGKLVFTFNNEETIGQPVTIHEASLFSDYVYLDGAERKYLRHSTEERLITQVEHRQYILDNERRERRRRMKFQLIYTTNFDGLSKEIIISTRKSHKHLDQINAVNKMKILLNGHDRIWFQNSNYFRFIQPYQHHTRTPTIDGIYVYSFAVAPEKHQVSGNLNFGRIDTSQIMFKIDKGDENVIIDFYNYRNNILVMNEHSVNLLHQPVRLVE